MIGKIAAGWAGTTIVYFLTLSASGAMYMLIFNEPPDRNWDRSGLVMGVAMLIMPYVIAGFYARLVFPDHPRTGAFWVSLVPVVGERVCIYGIGHFLALAGGDGSMEGITTMMFIRGEAAPYFTIPYIVGGVSSIALCMAIASVGASVNARGRR